MGYARITGDDEVYAAARRGLEALERDLLDRKQARQMVRDARAILDVDSARLVDEHPHEAAPRRAIPVDQLVAERGERAFEQITQVRGHQCSGGERQARRPGRGSKKKWAAPAHFSLLIGRRL